MKKVPPGIQKVVTVKKLAPVVQKQAPIAQNAVPNMRLLPITSCSCNEEGCSCKTRNDNLMKNNHPHNKESGCNRQESCWSPKKVVPMVKKLFVRL